MDSELVVETCKATKRFFKFFHATKILKNLNDLLVTNSFKNLSNFILDYFGDHIHDEEIFSDHHFQLVILILKNYFRIRIYYETIKKLDSTKVNRTRNLSTKLILFCNK